MKKLLSIFLSLLIIFSLSGCLNSTPQGDIVEEVITDEWFIEEPVTITKEELDEILNMPFTTPKNVIIMISDGMGPNDIILAEKYGENRFDFGLVLNHIKNHGIATTYCLDNPVTDSAASATALATGYKTNKGYVGVDKDGNPLKNITEIARECGKKVGVITNDSILGATPSAFNVHANSREDYSTIANAYMENLPDVFIGHEYSEFRKALSSENRKKIEDYNFVRDFYDINETLPFTKTDDRPLITFSNEGIFKKGSDDLSYLAQAGLKRLKNDNGFFLLIENTATDDAGHDNDINGKINGVLNFDRTVATVLKFMKKNPDTLLIVTSDHETGGVQLPKNNAEPDDSLFTTNEHTNTNVRVFAVGKGAEYFNEKTIDNTDIAKFAIKAVKGE